MPRRSYPPSVACRSLKLIFCLLASRIKSHSLPLFGNGTLENCSHNNEHTHARITTGYMYKTDNIPTPSWQGELSPYNQAFHSTSLRLCLLVEQYASRWLNNSNTDIKSHRSAEAYYRYCITQYSYRRHRCRYIFGSRKRFAVNDNSAKSEALTSCGNLLARMLVSVSSVPM
jgi:hypothetical protein